jgi:hypothetical protein
MYQTIAVYHSVVPFVQFEAMLVCVRTHMLWCNIYPGPWSRKNLTRLSSSRGELVTVSVGYVGDRTEPKQDLYCML